MGRTKGDAQNMTCECKNCDSPAAYEITVNVWGVEHKMSVCEQHKELEEKWLDSYPGKSE